MQTDVILEDILTLDSYIIINNGIIPIVYSKNAKVNEKSTEKNTNDLEIEEEFPEGKELTKLHKKIERNQKAVKQKKKQVLEETGSLICEACSFDFVKIYGELGYGFAECHHIIPVSTLKKGSGTKLKDLAIVCANCHRMLHRSRPLISIAQLKKIIQENQQ